MNVPLNNWEHEARIVIKEMKYLKLLSLKKDTVMGNYIKVIATLGHEGYLTARFNLLILTLIMALADPILDILAIVDLYNDEQDIYAALLIIAIASSMFVRFGIKMFILGVECCCLES